LDESAPKLVVGQAKIDDFLDWSQKVCPFIFESLDSRDKPSQNADGSCDLSFGGTGPQGETGN
jgi:hypothetical protein